MAYPGGKNAPGVYHTIINLMPPHQTYIEPFLGAGAIMRLKRPAALNIGIDIDPGAPKVTMPPVPSPDPSRSADAGKNGEAYRSRETAMADPHAASGDARHHHSPGAAIQASSGGTGDGVLPRFHFVHGNGIDFLACYPFAGNELVYCDPPYVMATRSGRRLYRCEMADAEHQRLLRVLQDLPCAAMISGYWSEMYAEALAGWNSVTYDAMTRAGKQKTEWLWFNFPRPTELHDYRYLGRGFREREKINRRKKRWVARLERMPELERHALLAAMAEVRC
jgi:hypothetical protein